MVNPKINETARIQIVVSVMASLKDATVFEEVQGIERLVVNMFKRDVFGNVTLAELQKHIEQAKERIA